MWTQQGLTTAGYGDVQAAAAANFVAGASASVCSQSLTVPLDVVSQRLMVHGNASSAAAAGGVRYTNGIQAARAIIAADGVAGLYRGLGASLATYMPASAVWWSAYGTYQKLLWHLLEVRLTAFPHSLKRFIAQTSKRTQRIPSPLHHPVQHWLPGSF